ncbi:MAG: response regulator [Burkholderiaceae bacterium]
MSSPQSQKKTLLVCDDDRLVLLSITTALRQAGYEVIETDNGDDAILLARQNRPDLAILDIAMDGKTGLDVAAYLRDYVNTPFMFLSAYGGDEAVERGVSFGAVDYLVKPIETTRLLSRLEKALSKLAEQAHASSLEPVAPLAPEGENIQRWVAAGILMERNSIELTEALRTLGDLAKQNQQSLNQVALDVVASVNESRITDS